MSRYREKYMDPEGERYGLPTYPWQCAPAGLATRRQLSERGLHPTGQHPCGQVLWPRGRDRHTGQERTEVAYLYRIDLARPKKTMTPGLWRTHETMMRPRRTCRTCRVVFPFDLSRKYHRTCWSCLEAEGVTV
jgi:hypothetical protein